MRHDAQGLVITASSDAAVAAWDHLVLGYLKNRLDLPQRLKALLAEAPDLALGHCFQGYMMMLGYKQALVPLAIAAERKARDLAAGATAREQAHVEALAAWIAGDIDRTLATWEGILAEHPRDVVAFRLAHFVAFWVGRPAEMVRSVERVLPAWSEADGAMFGGMLACRCFAHEEAGNLIMAEPAGRRAIELDPGDLWAAHAVAHVLEMQGRRREGLAWLAGLAPNWEGGNNLQHHLWWHAALYRLEQGDFAGVLELYDTRFRDLASPLVVANPDVYIDVQNAAAMLFRLERQEVDVGGRWGELADKAEARIGDCLSGFTLPHWMMALTAAGRTEAAGRMIEAMRAYANGDGQNARVVREAALPLCEGIVALTSGDAAGAVALMRPAIGTMHRLGGSHAQQDVLEQLVLEASLRAGATEDTALLLERVSGRRPLPPSRAIGWRKAAELVAV